MDTISLKKELLQYCQGQVEKRYSKIKQNIADIDGSLIEEAQHCKGDSLDISVGCCKLIARMQENS